MERIDRLQIWNQHSILQDFLTRDGHTIAIIGNGPVTGQDADAVSTANLVVRFNNWGSRSGDVVDKWLPIIGPRCDIMVGNFDCHTTTMGKEKIQGQDALEFPSQVVLGIPYPHHWKDADKFLDRFYKNASPYMVHPFWNRDLCAELGYNNAGYEHPLPTVGLTAIYHLMRMFEHLSVVPNFYVGGFTWYYDGEKDAIQGVDLAAERLPKGFNHYYAREALWVARALYGREQWHFSDLATKTLERLKSKQFSWE